MNSITLQEAQTGLADLIHGLGPGQSVTITEDNRPVARLVPISPIRKARRPRPPVIGIPKAGQYEGRLVVPDNFKEPLEEMREYME